MDDIILIAKSSIMQLFLPIILSCFLAVIVGYIAAFFVVGKRYVLRVISFCTMFAFYGVVLGFLIGASKDSLATDAFAAVVTLLSGYFGYILSKDINPRLKAMIPAAVICFLMSLLFSITFFLKLRLSFSG